MSAARYTAQKRLSTIAQGSKVQYANHRVSVDTISNGLARCNFSYKKLTYLAPPKCPCIPPKIKLPILDGGDPFIDFLNISGGSPTTYSLVYYGGSPAGAGTTKVNGGSPGTINTSKLLGGTPSGGITLTPMTMYYGGSPSTNSTTVLFGGSPGTISTTDLLGGIPSGGSLGVTPTNVYYGGSPDTIGGKSIFGGYPTENLGVTQRPIYDGGTLFIAPNSVGLMGGSPQTTATIVYYGGSPDTNSTVTIFGGYLLGTLNTVPRFIYTGGRV